VVAGSHTTAKRWFWIIYSVAASNMGSPNPQFLLFLEFVTRERMQGFSSSWTKTDGRFASHGNEFDGD